LEFIMPDKSRLPGWLGSLNLWVMFGARSRTQADYEELLTQAGFQTLQWLPCPDETMNLMFLEACPAAPAAAGDSDEPYSEKSTI
jgi:hypothetical protein